VSDDYEYGTLLRVRRFADIPDGRYYYLGRARNSKTMHLLELDERSGEPAVPNIYLVHNTLLNSQEILPWTAAPTPSKGQVWNKVTRDAVIRCVVSYAVGDVVVATYPGQSDTGVMGVAYTVNAFLAKHEYVGEGE
jgi:hypothetical protein